MKRYIRANRLKGRTFDYAGAGYVRKTLTLRPCGEYDYDYGHGGEHYICYFTDDDGARYAYYCRSGESPIFQRIDRGYLSPMKISCQVKEPLEYPASSNTDTWSNNYNWILRPRLLKF